MDAMTIYDTPVTAPYYWERVWLLGDVVREAEAAAKRIAASAQPSQSELDCALTRAAEAGYAGSLAWRESRLAQDEDDVVRIEACPTANRADKSCARWRRDQTRDELRLVRLAARSVEVPPHPCGCTSCSQIAMRRVAVAVEAEMDADWEADRTSGVARVLGDTCDPADGSQSGPCGTHMLGAGDETRSKQPDHTRVPRDSAERSRRLD